MTRKERKANADRRRQNILQRIADIAAGVVNSGGTAADAIHAAERWIQSEIRRIPHEKSMYVSAAQEYVRGLRDLTQSRANKDISCERGEA